MKRLRVTVRVDAAAAPELFALLADSPAIAETRLLDWNMSHEGADTVLYAIDGDPAAVAERAGDTPGVESVAVSDPAGGRAYALVVLRPLETPLFAAVHRASSHPGLVVRTPIVYRDGTMVARVVGDPEPLQRALEEAPDGVTVQIDEIGRLGADGDGPGLSERQREALAVARELGYYDQPRDATHADVAAELGCTPQTASEHLQKAEAKLVDAAFDEFDRPGY